MLAARSPIIVKPALRVAGFITLSFVLAGVSLGQIKSGPSAGSQLRKTRPCSVTAAAAFGDF